MSQHKQSLYELSGVVRDEAFLDSQLQVAGSNQSRVLEQLQKNKNSVKRQASIVKIIYAVLIGVLPIMPLFMYFEVMGMLSGGPPIDSIYIISVILITISSSMTFMYMLILGIISLSGFMTGDVFQWMEVLPIPQKNLQKLGALVLWRFFDIPLIVQMFVFPILMTIASGSILVFLACFSASLLNTLFIFFILVLITEKFSRIIKGGAANSPKVTIVRVLTMLGYVIAVTSSSLVINLVMNNIGTIIASTLTVENPGFLNLILSVIPFPFAPAYLVSLVFIPASTVPLPLVGTTSIGILILALLIRRLYRAVLNKLRNLTSHQARVALLANQPRPSQVEFRPITPVSPVKAFFRKDLASLTRDLQGFLYLFMPLIFPFVMFLQVSGPGGSLSWTGNIPGLYGYLLGFLVMMTVMDSGMLVSGILGIEDSGASIMASLPVLPRDQVKAKMKIIIIILLISHLLPLVILAGAADISLLFPFFLSYCLVGVAIAFLTLAIKVRLFGKMRYKYVVEEVNVNRKVMKWFAIIGIDSVLLLGLFFLVMLMGETLTTMGILVVFAVSGAGGLVVVLWWLHRMFPKQKSQTPNEIRLR